MELLSQFKYAVHLMPVQAAGTFALNCAYYGIPCIGYKGLDTQQICHSKLSVNIGDIKGAAYLAKKLKSDELFYKSVSKEAKQK